MFEVLLTLEARGNFHGLPKTIRARVQHVFLRLAQWPAVSGIKSLKGSLRGSYRIRTGDWRILFRVDEQARRVTVFRIDNRRDVYEE